MFNAGPVEPWCAMKRILLAAVLVVPGAVSWAADVPVPPCAGPAQPTYAAVGAPPNVKVWYAEQLEGWKPPACSGWNLSSADAVAASAARFTHAGTADDLLKRFAKVSDYESIPYWSPNNQEWRQLIRHANALSGPDVRQEREDFTIAELAKGDPLFLSMGGSTISDVVYRLQVMQHTPDRVTVAMENAVAIRVLGIPVLREGAAQFLFTFEREQGDVWNFYVLTRVGSVLNVIARPPMDQYANRAIALMRHFAGLPARDEASVIKR